MATSTTNLGLIKPAGTDKIRIAQINQNSDTLDAAIGPVGATSLQTQMNNVQDALAIIANGDTHPAITAGQFVYVKNNTHSVAEGLHVATANISANGQITTSNVSADASGGLNALNAKIANYQGAKEWVSNVDCNNYTSPGVYLLAQHLTNAPYTWFTLIVLSPRSDVIQQIALKGDGHITTRSKGSSSWSNWEGLALNSEIESFVKMGSTTGTTDANGNLQLTTASMSSVIFAWDGNHVCIPFFYNNKWYVRVQDVGSAGTAYTNHSVTVNYHYISRTIS